MTDPAVPLVTAIAKALNTAGVPCVLWGKQLLNVYGVPSIADSLSSPLKQRLPSYFLLATDNEHLPKSRPGRGYGAFPSEEYSVLVPSAPVFLEALMRIYARASETRVMISARTEIIYIFQYVDPDGFLDEESLPEPFRSSYRELKAAVKPVRQWAQDLRDALEEHDKNRQQDNSGFQAISI
ncbi:hypothetical protein M011DRAFT_410577 [Sporormia fimetaria CBS 119925]|uniref:Uncharacterized protein n=1 Tax=Sporormia fimetaria CBS 119925 TaxID=1340428 RepID=A0A6A6V1A9_9PLEO|nr:hypothetical protein M011DRAFT_410577 [Sporormia fimetaria CBS 119925]